MSVDGLESQPHHPGRPQTWITSRRHGAGLRPTTTFQTPPPPACRRTSPSAASRRPPLRRRTSALRPGTRSSPSGSIVSRRALSSHFSRVQVNLPLRVVERLAVVLVQAELAVAAGVDADRRRLVGRLARCTGGPGRAGGSPRRGRRAASSRDRPCGSPRASRPASRSSTSRTSRLRAGRASRSVAPFATTGATSRSRPQRYSSPSFTASGSPG